MICIIDYGAGNLRSVQKAVQKWQPDTIISADPEQILGADKVILPGVGAFGKAVQAIDERGLRPILLQVIEAGTPFLGICLGMQLLFDQSEENPGAPGLAVLAGDVRRFPQGLKVPHLGWNAVTQKRVSPLWENIPQESYFYFAHSYYIVPQDLQIVIGETDYGAFVPIAIQQGHIFGLQFHPEKSQKYGLSVLHNFVSLAVSGGKKGLSTAS